MYSSVAWRNLHPDRKFLIFRKIELLCAILELETGVFSQGSARRSFAEARLEGSLVSIRRRKALEAGEAASQVSPERSTSA